MEWIVIILWLSIINGALGGQYVLNWMANQPKYTGNLPIDISPGVMTWWREISKLSWAVVATTTEVIRGKEMKYLWPGMLSMATIMICAFTGVIENIGFFYLPRFYSPHIYAPYVNIYLVTLPFFGKILFNAPIRTEHWFGVILVIIGIAIPRMFDAVATKSSVLDWNAIIWIIIINVCLCSQQVLNNKTVQTALRGVGPNALVVWREIWKMVFISLAIFIFPLIASMTNAHLPHSITANRFEKEVAPKLDEAKKEFFDKYYKFNGKEYTLSLETEPETKEEIKKIIASTDYNRFFSLFEGSIIPNNWWPILFVVLAGLTGYIYSFGFFKLSRFAAHFWVPYTNVYLALLPFVMLLFGKEVTIIQVLGAVIVTTGLIVGVSDYSKNKVEEIAKKY
jgi:drug/metabolite transporter (DMT)-like permease